MKLIHKIIDMLPISTPSRNINSIDYWENNLDLMIEHYVNQKTDSDIELENQKLTVVFDEISEKKYSKILEIGCGFGYTLKKFASRFNYIDFYGCDFSQNLINGTKKYLKGIVPIENLQTASALDLSNYKDKYFDMVYTSGCLMCLKSHEVKSTINEIKRISKSIILMEMDFSNYGIAQYLKFKREIILSIIIQCL